MRSSPLVKKYGWGVHSDEGGRIAIYALGTDEYLLYQNDDQVRQIKGMRSSRK
jgi:outer membrane PBP1 activator LpoA protein